jgi:hypothetical protein
VLIPLSIRAAPDLLHRGPKTKTTSTITSLLPAILRNHLTHTTILRRRLDKTSAPLADSLPALAFKVLLTSIVLVAHHQDGIRRHLDMASLRVLDNFLPTKCPSALMALNPHSQAHNLNKLLLKLPLNFPSMIRAQTGHRA